MEVKLVSEHIKRERILRMYACPCGKGIIEENQSIYNINDISVKLKCPFAASTTR